MGKPAGEARDAPPSNEGAERREPAAAEVDVLGEIEHGFGNLLQRLRHAARAAAGPQGERLQAGLDDLEGLLALMFDYVSPMPVQARPIALATVVESLCAQLRGRGASARPGALCSGTVRVDPRLLNRCWQLLGEACVPRLDAAGDWRIETRPSVAGDQVECTLYAVSGAVPETSDPRATLAAAVAGRLLALQGGALRRGAGADTPYVVRLSAGEG